MASTTDKSPSASDMIDKVKLASTVLSCWVPTARVVSDVVATLCSSFSVAQEFSAALAHKDGGKSAASVAPAVATFALVALDSLGSAGAARPAPGQRGSPEKPITVPDSKTLSMIGQDGYPADAFYLQTGSFSHRSAEPGPLFLGYYDGGCHTITGLQSCLFGSLDRYSEVSDLRLSQITIDGDQPAMAALACTMESFARARNIYVENATIVNHGSGSNLRPATTGVVIGHQHGEAQLEDISLNHCSVKTSGNYSVAGGVVAIADGHLRRANVTNCQVITCGIDSHAGLGAGRLSGQMDDLALIDSRVFTHGRRSHAGGFAGVVLGDIMQMGASRCNVSTTGEGAAGGIGAGLLVGDASKLSVVECRVATAGPGSPAGIGAGEVGYPHPKIGARLHDLVAIDSDVRETGPGRTCGAGVGAGLVYKDGTCGAGVGAGLVYKDVERITSVRCRVSARFRAGVGAGINRGRIDDVNSVNSHVKVSAAGSAGIGAGCNDDGITSLMSWNSRINGKPYKNTGTYEPQNLCQSADPRFIQPNCIATPSPLDGLQTCQLTNAFPKRGTAPIAVDSAQTLNRIGLDSNYPANASYIQTTDIDGSKLSSDGSMIFSGHYDGQNYIIRNQTACLFKNLFGTVRNLHLVDARIDSDQPAAVVACEMDGAGGVESILIDNCHVATRSAPAGIIFGRQKSDQNKVGLVNVHSSMASSDGKEAPAGMVGGECRGQIERVAIRSSRVNTSGVASHAGLGCGDMNGGMFQHFSAACSQVETTGPLALSGIGVGKAFSSGLGPATIVNCNLTTSGPGADAGLAVGMLDWQSELNNFTILDSRVLTRKANAAAGIGTLNDTVEAKGVTAVRCEVFTEADGTHAGIGAGLSNEKNTLSDITAVNCSLSAPGRDSYARVPGSYIDGRPVGATGTWIANTWINGQLHNNTNIVAQTSTFCAGADPAFVNPTCHVDQGGCLLPPLTIAAPTPLLATALSSLTLAGIAAGTVFILGAALAGYCRYLHRQPDEADQSDKSFQRLLVSMGMIAKASRPPPIKVVNMMGRAGVELPHLFRQALPCHSLRATAR